MPQWISTARLQDGCCPECRSQKSECKSARSSIFFFAIFLSALRSRRLNAFTAKVAKNAQRTQRNLRISSYRLDILNSAFLILHSEFSLLHTSFPPKPCNLPAQTIRL